MEIIVKLSDMSFKQFLLVIGILLLPIIYVLSSKSEPENEIKKNSYAKKLGKRPISLNYTYFPLEQIKFVKIKPEIGRLVVHIRNADKPGMEIHKSFLSSVNFEIKEDSLIIYSSKPQNEETKKYVNLFLPNFEVVDCSVSTLIINGFNLDKCLLISSNNYLRLLNNQIKNLEIDCKYNSVVQLDRQNILDNAEIKLDSKSTLRSRAIVQEKLKIYSENRAQARIKETNEDKIQWIKL